MQPTACGDAGGRAIRPTIKFVEGRQITGHQETQPDARKLSRWLGHLTSICFQLDVHSRAALATEIAPIVSDRPSRTASP